MFGLTDKRLSSAMADNGDNGVARSWAWESTRVSARGNKDLEYQISEAISLASKCRLWLPSFQSPPQNKVGSQ